MQQNEKKISLLLKIFIICAAGIFVIVGPLVLLLRNIFTRDSKIALSLRTIAILLLISHLSLLLSSLVFEKLVFYDMEYGYTRAYAYFLCLIPVFYILVGLFVRKRTNSVDYVSTGLIILLPTVFLSLTLHADFIWRHDLRCSQDACVNFSEIENILENYADSHNRTYPSSEEMAQILSTRSMINPYSQKEHLRNIEFGTKPCLGDITYLPVEIDEKIIGYYLLGYGRGSKYALEKDVDGDGLDDQVIALYIGPQRQNSDSGLAWQTIVKMPPLIEMLFKDNPSRLIETRENEVKKHLKEFLSDIKSFSHTYPHVLPEKHAWIKNQSYKPHPRNPFDQNMGPMREIQFGDPDFAGNFSYLPVKTVTQGYNIHETPQIGFAYLLAYGSKDTPGEDVNGDGKPDHVIDIIPVYGGLGRRMQPSIQEVLAVSPEILLYGVDDEVYSNPMSQKRLPIREMDINFLTNFYNIQDALDRFYQTHRNDGGDLYPENLTQLLDERFLTDLDMENWFHKRLIRIVEYSMIAQSGDYSYLPVEVDGRIIACYLIGYSQHRYLDYTEQNRELPDNISIVGIEPGVDNYDYPEELRDKIPRLIKLLNPDNVENF